RLLRNTGGEVDRRGPGGVNDACLEERGVYALALARLQAMHVGRYHAERAEDAGADVADRHAGFDGWAARPFAGDAHDAAHALRDEVEAGAIRVRAGGAEAGDLAINEPAVRRTQRVVAEAEILHRTGTEVFDDDIGRRRHPAKHRLAALALQIERHAALVAVQNHERGRFVVDLRRHHAARVVAVGEFFDLDDVGAHVGE